MTSWAPSLDAVFSPKAICAILRTASECGVSRLKLGSLEVRFFDPASQPGSRQDESHDFSDSQDRDSALEGETTPPKVPKDLVERFAEEQELLDDPLAFETRLIDQQLGRERMDEEA